MTNQHALQSKKNKKPLTFSSPRAARNASGPELATSERNAHGATTKNESLEGEREGETPNARKQFINAVLTGAYDYRRDFRPGKPARYSKGLAPSEARYALHLGFDVWAEWEPYPTRTVQKLVTRIDRDKPDHLLIHTSSTGDKPIRLKVGKVYFWTDRNQRTAAKAARTE